MYSPTMTESQLLKKDLFGEIWLIVAADEQCIVRDSGAASGLDTLARASPVATRGPRAGGLGRS